MTDLLVLPTGPFVGRWIRYRPRNRVRSPFAALCLRCAATTTRPGAMGWMYRRSELGRPSGQLCPACVTVLRHLHSECGSTDPERP